MLEHGHGCRGKAEARRYHGAGGFGHERGHGTSGPGLSGSRQEFGHRTRDSERKCDLRYQASAEFSGIKSMKSEMTATARVVLVAGGTGGLGRAVSLAFLEEDARVFVTYRKQEELDILKNLAVGKGSQLNGFSADVTNEAEVGKLVE